MKFIRFLVRFTVAIIIAILLVCLGLWLSGNSHVIKAVRSTYLMGEKGPTIDDYSKFENRTVQAGNPKKWNKASTYNQFAISKELLLKMEEMETSALVVIKNNKLVFEQYWNNYSEKSKTNSFSMAKSFTSLCIGAAIKDGKIKSVNQRVSDFIPEFKSGKKEEITIKDLLTMSSGINFGESYGNPFGFMAETYYGTELYNLTVKKEVQFNPGTVWQYQGGNTLLLSFILEKATGMNLSEYFSTKFWKPLGATQNALWTIDKEGGKEKSYCCFYSNALDYAKIGQLMLDSGNWNGVPIITKDFFKNSIKPVNILSPEGKNIDHYGYQWWLGQYENSPFTYARGIQGQYIVSIPEWNMVVVRLGHKRDPERGAIIPKDLFYYLEFAKQLN